MSALCSEDKNKHIFYRFARMYTTGQRNGWDDDCFSIAKRQRHSRLLTDLYLDYACFSKWEELGEIAIEKAVIFSIVLYERPLFQNKKLQTSTTTGFTLESEIFTISAFSDASRP